MQTPSFLSTLAMAASMIAGLSGTLAAQQPAASLKELQFLHDVQIAEAVTIPYKAGVA